ncbi:MAG: 6-carboxytetrahydropterin synthase [Flavobacteriales bacterium]|jgi:6-pyruvoyltetrahydropterin/6-carboxytetrahydropterin synthase|nr:6-carboxytetrahydropterin synthase [Flavobacteriales bacterium]
MKTVYVTRRERFNAAHQMWNFNWTDEKNEEVFGKCSNKNWHGHNYELFVTVKGVPHPETGYCVDLKEVSRVINERVINHLDHKNINLEVPFMKGKLASTENLTIAIWEELEEAVKALGATLYKVKLNETENNFVEYFGEE